MRDVKIQAPSFDGLGLEPNMVLALDSVVKATQKALDEMAKSGAADITVTLGDGKQVTLDQLAEYLPWKGVVWGVHMSWVAAFMRKGWRVCDGTRGTPSIHPRPGDSPAVQRFIRAVKWGGNSGGLDGSEDHAHTSHVAHYHTVNASTVKIKVVTCDSGTEVSLSNHTHVTADYGAMAHVASAHTPQCCDLIFLMKV